MKPLRICLGLLSAINYVATYELFRDYSGQTFFDEWDFYGSWDNLTNGDVWWLDREDSLDQRLAFINHRGNAVIKVDNSSDVPFNEKRDTVRITTKDVYNFGSVWIIDVLHLPFGCSVWPAFWSKGPTWPDDGEIDIIEAVNLMEANQYALHTLPGCWHSTPPEQISKSNPGQNGEPGEDCSTAPGCTVTETRNNSLGESFARGGGGVWATQFDVEGVFIWFWPRDIVPASILQADSTSSISLLDWGHPSASYPATNCTMDEFFKSQQLVLDITLCGDWAGIGPVYNASCGASGPTGLCYPDNVVGPGSPRYDDAFFEIRYVRTYTTGSAVPSPTTAVTSTSTSTSTSPSTSTSTLSATRTGRPTATPSNEEPAVVVNSGVGLRFLGPGGSSAWIYPLVCLFSTLETFFSLLDRL